MKKRILFVDDEANVLDGLRRMLRPLQHEWDIGFAEGGAQALALLPREPFDVIVSDMRMPGMTGVQLLEEVGRQFPRMVRIILTGQCDDESELRARRVAHQILYKPCDAESLKSIMARSASLSDMPGGEAFPAMVDGQTSPLSVPTCIRKACSEPPIAGVDQSLSHTHDAESGAA